MLKLFYEKWILSNIYEPQKKLTKNAISAGFKIMIKRNYLNSEQYSNDQKEKL